MDTSKMKESMNSFRNKMNSKRAVMASSATSDGENPAAPSDAVEEGVPTTTDQTRSSSNGADNTGNMGNTITRSGIGRDGSIDGSSSIAGGSMSTSTSTDTARAGSGSSRTALP